MVTLVDGTASVYAPGGALHRLDRRSQALSTGLRWRTTGDTGRGREKSREIGVRNRPLCSRNIVEVTTVVDLSGQLSNLREVIVRLFEEFEKPR